MSNQKKKKNAEWIKISNGAFTLLKNRIDNAVNKNLGTFIDKEKINYLPFQEFLQNILDGRFNNAEEAREYYTTNIYKNYEIKMNNVCTPAVEEMKDTFKEVKKILHQQFVLMKKAQTQIQKVESLMLHKEKNQKVTKIHTCQNMKKRTRIKNINSAINDY